MDPLSVGASAVTFVGLALSITKVVHDGLSTIKDGPNVIRCLSDEFAQLKNILERLSHIPMSIADATELGGLAEKCRDDVASFEAKLRRLDTSGADGRRCRAWRKLKLFFTERDLEEMRHVIRGHIQLLTVGLSIFQIQQGSFSATQSTELLNLVLKLGEDVAALRRVNSVQTPDQGSTRRQVVELDEMDEMPGIGSNLDHNIARLMRLLEKKPCVIESDDAQELVGDLEHLLRSAQRDATSRAASHPRNDDASRELKIVMGLILSAPSMKLNQNGPLTMMKAMPQGTVIHQERKRRIIDMGDGTVTLTTTKRQRRHSTQPGDATIIPESQSREFGAKLVFKPKRTATMLTVSVNQGQLLFDSFTSMLPTITVNNILPRDSLVFQLASSGSIQELMALVEEGKASLHDHDTDGKSLLHHSGKNPSMCKFLVEQGLDVNELSGSSLTPLHYARPVPETIQCLLIAGADPTIALPHSQSFFGNASNQTDARGDFMLRRMFIMSPFIRYADRKGLECNPFLICCTTPFQRRCSDAEAELCLSRLRFLSEQGYSVHDKYPDGTNGLSDIMRYAENQQYCKAQKDILMYLTNHGADVHSPDIKGICVSTFAYNQAFCAKCREVYPPYLGDLWDSVLDECGYDILEFRKLCPRRARYTEEYTRQVFEQLWQGREHRCPYWNDEPWPTAPLEDAEKAWVFLDGAGQICLRCETCFGVHLDGQGFFCGTCGFCISILDCQCAQDGTYGHRESCPRPLQRLFGWDGENYRFYFVEDDDLSAQDPSDNKAWSLEMFPRGNGQEHQTLSVSPQEDHHWDTLSSTSSQSFYGTADGLPSPHELFDNPWDRDWLLGSEWI